MNEADDLPRVFLTCAARAVPAVAPLVEEAERRLLDAGWRTRIPQRAAPRDGTALDERRRLRRASYAEVERADVVVHVPAPERLCGTKLHRELQHALRHSIPVALLVAMRDRDRLDIGRPAPDRVSELAAETRAAIIESLDTLPDVLAALRRRRHGLPLGAT